MKILEQKVITLAQAREILEKTNKEYETEEMELLYEQKRALDHARKFSKLAVGDIKKMGDELKGLDLDLKNEHIVKICDFLPDSVDRIRAIFAKERFRYDEEQIKKILDVVAKYK